MTENPGRILLGMLDIQIRFSGFFFSFHGLHNRSIASIDHPLLRYVDNTYSVDR